MSMLVKHLSEVAAHINRSPQLINKLRRTTTLNLCQDASGWWDLEKVTAWQALREDLGHPPSEKEMSAANLSVRKVNIAEDRSEVEKYKLNRVEVLAKGQLKRQKLANNLIDDIQKELEGTGSEKGLTNHEKINALRALDSGFGIMYDKERLEMGESTENVAVIVGAIKDLKRKREREYGI